MFLINSSVGSFAAAPSSIKTKLLEVQKNKIILLLISEKIYMVIKGFVHQQSLMTVAYSCVLVTHTV